MFNGEGQVIGIAQSGFTSNYQCINFAVSSNKVQRMADAFINQGSFTSAIFPGTWSMDDLTPDVAIARGLDSTFGVIINLAIGMHDVVTNDIIIAIDGISVTDGADLFSYIAQFKSVGDTVTLTLLRGSGTSITTIEDTLTLVPGWIS